MVPAAQAEQRLPELFAWKYPAVHKEQLLRRAVEAILPGSHAVHAVDTLELLKNPASQA